jgi:hypothetical protein
MGPIDDINIRWDVAPLAANNESIDIGVYSFDGNTKVFDCDIVDAGETGTAGQYDQCKSGTPTDNAEILQPGDYWVCIASEATSGTTTAMLGTPAGGDGMRTCRFAQTCTGSGGEAVLPSTLTSESCTWQTSRRAPGVIFHAE